MAFRVNAARVEWPQWMRDLSVSDQPRFDIQATIPPGIERARVPDMLRGLLVERFGLVARTEMRPLKVYGLVVATGGHKMREVEAVNDLERKFPVGASERVSSDDTITQFTHESLIRDNNEVRVIEFDRETQRTVTSQSLFMTQRNRDKGTRDIDAERITMAELAQELGRPNDIPIVDRTGLDGVYQLRVTIPDDVFAFVSSRSSIITDRNGNLIGPSRDVYQACRSSRRSKRLGCAWRSKSFHSSTWWSKRFEGYLRKTSTAVERHAEPLPRQHLL